MNFKNKQLIIFDLDGTLVDSAPDLANAINKMLVSLGRAEFSQQQIRGWVGNGVQVLVERALAGSTDVDISLEQTLLDKALHSFLTFYRQAVCVDSSLYPQVRETLTTLKAHGYRLAIVTNKPVEFIEPILQALAVSDLFEQALGGDSLAAKKPDPLPLLHLSEQLGVALQDCLMVGDSKNDIIAAQNANMHSVGLTYGYNYDEDIAVYHPDFVADEFKQLLDCLAVK